ncbi:hypothetical protein R7J86_27055, partial [Klebsiella pneumoniae]|nr:hypothetical protein [Klebsiella pneumoniae]
LNRLIRCVCGKKIGPDPRNFNQRVSLGRNDLLIRTFPKKQKSYKKSYPAVMHKAHLNTSLAKIRLRQFSDLHGGKRAKDMIIKPST